MALLDWIDTLLNVRWYKTLFFIFYFIQISKKSWNQVFSCSKQLKIRHSNANCSCHSLMLVLKTPPPNISKYGIHDAILFSLWCYIITTLLWWYNITTLLWWYSCDVILTLNFFVMLFWLFLCDVNFCDDIIHPRFKM
jgi:hypothetical protein